MSQLKEKNLYDIDNLSPHFQTLSAEDLLGEPPRAAKGPAGPDQTPPEPAAPAAAEGTAPPEPPAPMLTEVEEVFRHLEAGEQDAPAEDLAPDEDLPEPAAEETTPAERHFRLSLRRPAAEPEPEESAAEDEPEEMPPAHHLRHSFPRRKPGDRGREKADLRREEQPGEAEESGEEAERGAEQAEEPAQRASRRGAPALQRLFWRPKTPDTQPAEPSPQPEAAGEQPEAVFTVEDVVSSTVESVLEERQDDARRFQKQRRKTQRQQEKIHRSNTQRATDTVDFSQEEPSLVEATLRQKRRYRRLRKIAITASILVPVYWIPTILGLFSVSIPYFSTDLRISAAIYTLLHIAACTVGWQTFALGMTHLFQGKITCHFAVALCNVVTLLDTATMPFLSQRLDAAPLGGISLVALALDLWGECWHAGALKENFRLVALGKPAYVVDLTQDGAVKQPATADGFYNRTVREDEAIGWQSLLLPVILVASLVFGVLASFGQGAGQNFLWSWSAILTAGTALSLPFIYSMAYFRLSTRLGKSGCAVAGLYGAKQLSYSKEILIGDEDLFPAGTMRMAGMKLIAEDRRKVAAYAGSLARAYGGTWPGLFDPFMQAEGATPQRLDQFHVHEEGGVSATIHGETVILGIANLIRKMSVRLPKSLEWKDGLFLAIDGELVAIFGVVYEPADSVGWSLGAMRRSGLTPLLATRDPNLHPRFLRTYFGTDGGAVLLDLNQRLNLSREQRRPMRPNALLYRSGLAPFLEAVAGSKRLCRAVYTANAITLFGCVVGTLLAFYLVFLGRASMLTPPQLLLFLGLWTVPVLLLAWNTDKI